MIVLEERLAALFAHIPARTYTDAQNKSHAVPAPTYHFGDEIEANKLIKLGLTYPLIYQTLVLPERQVTTSNWVEADIDLVLAVRNTETDLLNTVRWATSYKNILMPLFEEIDRVFQKGGIMYSDWNYTVTKFPNYGNTAENSTKNKFNDIVDALRIRLNNVKITSDCIKL